MKTICYSVNVTAWVLVCIKPATQSGKKTEGA
jgi:hypothetical protein